MDQRVKWLLGADLEARMLARLAEAFRLHRFSKSSERGVIVSSVRPEVVTGRYIERVEDRRSVTDPFGNVLELPSVTYETVNFRLSIEAPQLEVVNAPRSLRGFLLFLGELSSFGFRAVEPQLDVIRWIERVGAKAGRTSFTAIECSDVQVSAAAAANMVFYGDGDLHREVTRFLGTRTFAIERVQVAFVSTRLERRCRFDRTGRVRLPVGDEELLGWIRQALAAQIR